ncbi:MAG: FAD-dependent thymidylate synthase [Limnochordia bacterium]|jgi:thymidylate synthase ThyX
MYNPADRAILAHHVTSIEGNVYCIKNLPEEVIAVIFAYVSRSPKSFRDNLLRLVKEGSVITSTRTEGDDLYAGAVQKAAAFHERWVVGYGHSSVAEHAVAHVGVENISRLASAELELANPFISFTEYSQRYQKPERGHFYTPDELPSHLATEYENTMHALYDAYERLYNGLTAYLERSMPQIPDETSAARANRLAKLAFEDARYALPLATYTNLGLSGNGRALRDGLAVLGASEYPECRHLADQIIAEVSQVLPTLLRHTTPSTYLSRLSDQLRRFCPIRQETPQPFAAGAQVRLVNYIGKGSTNAEHEALQLLGQVIGVSEQADVDDALVGYLSADMSEHDMLPQACRWIRYDAAMLLSEAAWHQLLRHMRGMAFQWGPPEPINGYTVPPHIAAAGLTEVLAAAVMQSNQLYSRLTTEVPHLGAYAITNAHRRRIRTEFDLRQLYHLVNLRVSEHAQWDIKDAVTQLWQQIAAVHPRLSAKARRRS